MSVSNNELGELLIDLGLISPEQLSEAIVQQQNSGTRLTVVLSEMGLITERQLKDALELQYGVNFVNLSSAPPESEYVRLVPEEVERQFRFVPVSMQGNQFTVAMVDPDDLVAAEAIRQHLSSANFKKLVCTADDFEHLMYATYEAPPESEQVEVDASIGGDVSDDDFAGASPRASQTKLKAHMRNLFESDSDDDLDSMFGRSSDSLPALKESDFEQSAKTDEKEPKKKTKKAISKKITSLFDDDDDDDFGDGAESPAAPLDSETEFAQDPSLGEEEFADEQLRSRPELTADIATGEAPAQEETMPSNQLLEHILQEAGVPKSKPKKMKPKKKSMQSLFDDDDDDMDFDEPASAAEAAQAPEERLEVSDDVEMSNGVEAASDSGAFPEITGQEENLSDAGIDPLGESLTGESLVNESYAGGSLNGDDSYTGGSLTGPDSFDESAPRSDFGGDDVPAQEPAEDQPKKSVVSKAFRSLFDDEMDEDDLFGSESESEEAEQVEPEFQSPELLADVNAPEVVAEQSVEQESAESLMTAIERPFQSLFDDDDDDDDLFGASPTASSDVEPNREESPSIENQFSLSETLMSSEEFEQAVPVEKQHSEFEPNEPEVDFGPESNSDSEALIQSAEEVEENIKPAYHASFDDEMDEDSLFASASHPIPEGAPHLRDLLSRFDDSDAAFDALEDSLNQKHSEIPIETPEPPTADEQDAELAVSALIAALDEQVPDETISIPPRHTPVENESTQEEVEIGAEASIPELQEPAVAESTYTEEPVVAQIQSFDDPPSQYDRVEHVASLPEVSQEVPAISPPEKKPVANPKSKKLRAMMMDDDDDFGMPSREESSATISSELEPVAEQREDFDDVLPLDQEDLMPRSNATTELPPVVVSRSAKTMTQGTSIPEDKTAPAVSSFDEEVIPSPQAPGRSPSLEETLPPPPVQPRTPESTPKPALQVDISVQMPATAAELPDALDDVLSNVTNELIDNVELANLSGNRTEISFLEEIVESELALDDQAVSQQPTEVQPAAASPTPAPLPAPVAQPPVPATTQASAPAQPSSSVQSEPAQAPLPQTPAATPAPGRAQAAPVQQAPATPEQAPQPAIAPAPQPLSAQQPAAAAPVPVSSDLSVSQSAVEKLNLDPSILNLATQILTQAVNSPCSDVHFEPLADGLALRFMSDGDLLDETILPAQIQGMLILCLKSMAGLDPSVVDRPQDKRFITRSFGEPVEMRITSIPGMHGEMVAVSLRT